MEKNNKYEKMYDILLEYEKKIHERNQRRIRIGLKCIWIIPLIFLFLLFWTDSSKIIFLILWIASLFIIAMYLIGVEYMDYRLQEKLHELDEDAEISNLMVGDLNNVESVIKAAISRLDFTLNSQEEIDLIELNQMDNHKEEEEQIETKKEALIEEHDADATSPSNDVLQDDTQKKEETDHEKHI